MKCFPDEKHEEFLTCQDCGITSGDVEKTICPYDQDINGIETEIIVCSECLYQRGMDI